MYYILYYPEFIASSHFDFKLVEFKTSLDYFKCMSAPGSNQRHITLPHPVGIGWLCPYPVKWDMWDHTFFCLQCLPGHLQAEAYSANYHVPTQYSNYCSNLCWKGVVRTAVTSTAQSTWLIQKSLMYKRLHARTSCMVYTGIFGIQTVPSGTAFWPVSGVSIHLTPILSQNFQPNRPAVVSFISRSQHYHKLTIRVSLYSCTFRTRSISNDEVLRFDMIGLKAKGRICEEWNWDFETK